MKKLSLFLFLGIFGATWSQQLVPFQKNGKWGFCDLNKKEIIKPKYYEVTKFNSNGLSIVMDENNKKGVIDTLGNSILPIKYSTIFFDPTKAYYGSSSTDYGYDYYYTDYGYSEAQQMISKWMKNPDNTYYYFKNDVILVVNDQEIIWFNKQGKEILKSSKKDELVSN